MTPDLWEACAWSAGRALVVSAASLLVAVAVRSVFLRTHRPQMRRLAWALLLIPLLTPAILIGYAYGNLWLELIRHPLLVQVLYAVLLLFKLAPAAALVVCLAPPPPLTPEAAHAARLLGRAPGGRLRLWVHGQARTAAMALALVFLLAFQEFEIVSLLAASNAGRFAWSVWVFDQQAGGLPPIRSLLFALGPMAVELLALIPLAALLLPKLHEAWSTRPSPTRLPRVVRGLAWVYLFVAAIATAGLPLGIVVGAALMPPAGHRASDLPLVIAARTLASDSSFARQLHAGVLFALAGATMAIVLVALIGRCSRRWRIALNIVLCLPGLVGSLVLSLLVLTGSSWVASLLAPLPGPLPLVIALSLLLAAPAILLGAALRRRGRDPSLHVARLLGRSLHRGDRIAAGKITWALSLRPRFWAAFLLFCWAFFELTAPAILSPPGMDTAVVGLYNQMHNHQTHVLSAMLALTILTPLCLLAVAWLFRVARLMWVKYV